MIASIMELLMADFGKGSFHETVMIWNDSQGPLCDLLSNHLNSNSIIPDNSINKRIFKPAWEWHFIEIEQTLRLKNNWTRQKQDFKLQQKARRSITWETIITNWPGKWNQQWSRFQESTIGMSVKKLRKAYREISSPYVLV